MSELTTPSCIQRLRYIHCHTQEVIVNKGRRWTSRLSLQRNLKPRGSAAEIAGAICCGEVEHRRIFPCPRALGFQISRLSRPSGPKLPLPRAQLMQEHLKASKRHQIGLNGEKTVSITTYLGIQLCSPVLAFILPLQAMPPFDMIIGRHGD
jgi:hypothetical protein